MIFVCFFILIIRLGPKCIGCISGEGDGVDPGIFPGDPIYLKPRGLDLIVLLKYRWNSGF